jgi:sugar lactone lactonase YvrE
VNRIETLDDGLFLPESPRWHDGQLWLSDILHKSVFWYDAAWRKHTFAVFDDDPSGLGWDADGNLLAAGMRDRKLLRVTADGVAVVAELAGQEPFMLNDMAVSRDGTAFITRFGSDVWHGEPLDTVQIIRVFPDGRSDLIGPEVAVPNGIALSADESALYVAETARSRIWIVEDPLGSASESRVFAELPADESSGVGIATPDGICLDRRGGLWIADPLGHRVLHLGADGSVLETVGYPLDDQPLAVATDDDGGVLFVAVAKHPDLFAPRVNPVGRIDRVLVGT